MLLLYSAFQWLRMPLHDKATNPHGDFQALASLPHLSKFQSAAFSLLILAVAPVALLFLLLLYCLLVLVLAVPSTDTHTQLVPPTPHQQ